MWELNDMCFSLLILHCHCINKSFSLSVCSIMDRYKCNGSRTKDCTAIGHVALTLGSSLSDGGGWLRECVSVCLSAEGMLEA